MSHRRVVVTGMGIVSPIGNTLAAAWDSIQAGRSGIGPITHFDPSAYATRIAGEVRDFDAKSFLPPKDVKKMDTFIHYGLAACFQAMDDAGLEVTANTDFGKLASLNFSSNTFYNTIDASNLGFSASKSDVSWLAKLGVTLHLPRDTQVQFNTNYSSARLTPQGERRPTWVANLGARHDFAKKKAAVVLTVSDLFNSLKETNVLDTPLLKETVMRRRSSRIVYLGFIYNFGAPAKKNKDDSLKFDNSL